MGPDPDQGAWPRSGGSVTHLLAYIDPGSGSLIIQAAIAAVIAIPIFFRTQIARIVRTFRGPKEDETAADDPAGTD
jgi:hypothetical protein